MEIKIKEDFILRYDITREDTTNTVSISFPSLDKHEEAKDIEGTPVWIHWGVGVSRKQDWVSPHLVTQGRMEFPETSKQWDDKASQTLYEKLPIVIKADKDIQALNFVVKEGETWHNNGGKDYHIQLAEPNPNLPSGRLGEIIENIIQAEVEYGSWTLWHRFMKCYEFFESSEDIDLLSVLVIWMRYSYIRKLDWQRRYNTRPSQLAHEQKKLSLAVAGRTRDAPTDKVLNEKTLLRMLLSTMGKGGDHGQRIRDEILHIMHRHNIKEIHGTYYEQWHQKLHNNTTPDDIGICEAIIAYNETNDMNTYWEVLHSHGLNRERLASFDRAITTEPYHQPQIIGDLKNYLGLLKSVHSAGDLGTMVDGASWTLDEQTNHSLREVLNHNDHFDVIVQIERVTNTRKMIHLPGDINALRDVIYLDIALESYVRQLCERIAQFDFDIGLYRRILNLLFDNILLINTNVELKLAIDDFHAAGGVENHIDILYLKSVLDRIQRYLGDFVDKFNDTVQTKAEILGRGCDIDEPTVLIFSEELIRGSIWFAVSQIIRKIGPKLRALANLGTWQVISPYTSVGTFESVTGLKDTAQPTILGTTNISGDEEVPNGVTGVVTPVEIDVLAHLSVRARNQKVFLGVCYDQEEWESLEKYNGRMVKVFGQGQFEEVQSSGEQQETVVVEVKAPKPLANVAIKAKDFEQGVTGAKGNNCAKLRNELPEWIGVPESVALPFRVFEEILEDNKQLVPEYNRLLAAVDLNGLQKLIQDLEIADVVRDIIYPVLQSIGVDNWDEAWATIKRVWASKFNERAYVSTQKAGIQLSDIYMSVLVQKVIEADYAFVIHTDNPMTSNPEELYAEVVVGMGEALVGAYPGRSLGIAINKTTKETQILSIPNKGIALRGTGFMFRSDSNSEDLVGFAGAGLFDSYPTKPMVEVPAAYASENIARNMDFISEIAIKLLEVGQEVVNLYERAQDIEGCIKDGKYYVVQTRPQV